MTKDQIKDRNKIIIVAIIYAAILICDKSGLLAALPRVVTALLYLIPYLVVGFEVLKKAAIGIKNLQPFDENFLMAVASLAAFIMGEYSEAVAVMLFYQIGELFEDYAVGRSRASITEMMNIAPEYANLLKDDGSTEEVDPEDVKVGDIILVKPGEKIPLDGTVIEGTSLIDTAALTGESVPRKAAAGDEVISGCVNKDGTLKIKVEKAYEDSTVSRILELVENASEKKARMENFITRFARYYTPVVVIGAVVLAILPPVILMAAGTYSGTVRELWSDWIYRACTFLIVSCPCALVISVPLGFFGGIGAASKIGVLIKGSNYIEAAAAMDTVVMDKTGTITKGKFEVSELYPASGVSEDELLTLAAYAEGYSNHPIAKSVENAYHSRYGNTSDVSGHQSGQDDAVSTDNASKIDLTRISDYKEEAGQGISAEFDGRKIVAGNEKLMNAHNISFERADAYGTVIYVAYDGQFKGYLIIRDTIKSGAAEAVRMMKAAGIRRTVMLTGDRKETAEAVASEVGIDEVHSDLLPADKVTNIENILNTDKTGKVGFVGDGINDAPVLMRADVGFAMGAMGSDAAIEAADIVLMDDDIRKIAQVIQISRKTVGIVKWNVTFALVVKIAILILGALGIATMWLAVFGDVGVAIICIINSMRALNVKKQDNNSSAAVTGNFTDPDVA